ncbi:hypothetical protein DYB31_007287 [Aphanomyces astaci]|uniref:Myb/SANT-like domain-containing protein n=1 Tax=Aphanomyces astaci TaxID=112090 RepID=A0A397F841_APHAT|nr:hypothetical protein DYB31_007287 [Aphanomyces astaci]
MTTPTKPAKWNLELEIEFIALVRTVERVPRFRAAGGKSLRAEGWRDVLKSMHAWEPSIKSKDQLSNKWKRLKTDYTDYHFLVTCSGYGDGFLDVHWLSLDTARSRKSTLARFRDVPFEHYDAMAVVVDDALATAGALTGIDDVFGGDGGVLGERPGDGNDGDDAEPPFAHIDETNERDVDAANVDQDLARPGDMASAKRRAAILNKLKQNRKQKSIDQDDPTHLLRHIAPFTTVMTFEPFCEFFELMRDVRCACCVINRIIGTKVGAACQYKVVQGATRVDDDVDQRNLEFHRLGENVPLSLQPAKGSTMMRVFECR